MGRAGYAPNMARMGVVRWFCTSAVAVCAALSCVACGIAAPAVVHKLCTPNTVLPYDRPLGLRIQELDAPDFDLAKYRGQGVVLNIFATWCGACQYELPYLLAAAKQYADRGVRVVLVDYDERDNTVRHFRSKEHVTLPIAMDRSGGFTRALEIGTNYRDLLFPSTLFIAPDGRLTCFVQRAMDADEWDREIDKIVPAASPTGRAR